MRNAKTLAWSLVLCSLGTGALALAQSSPPPATAAAQCPMRAAAELSDIKVEQTKTGAIIRLNAKRAEDVSKVQAHAQQIATALSTGSCPMHPGHDCMQNHDHQHDHHHHQHDKAASDAK